MLRAIQKLFASESKPYIPAPNKNLRVDLGSASLELSVPEHAIKDLKPVQERNINLPDLQLDQEEKAFGRLLIKMAWPIKTSILSSNNSGLMTMTCQARWIDGDQNRETCFKKDFFEAVILRDLYFSVGPGSASDRIFSSPEHWRVINFNGAEWIYCESWEVNPPCQGPLHYCYFFSPISNSIYIRIHFYIIDGTKKGNGMAGMKELMRNIMVKSNLSLGEKSRAERVAIEEQWPLLKYSAKRSPEPWDYPEGDRGEMTVDERVLRSKTPPTEIHHQ